MRAVTPILKKQVEAALAANEVHNLKHGLKKGMAGYRIESHQDLATHPKVNADPNSIKNMFGGVRPGTKIKPVKKSRLVDPICDVLGIERLVRVEVEVPQSVADFIKEVATWSVTAVDELAATVRNK